MVLLQPWAQLSCPLICTATATWCACNMLHFPMHFCPTPYTHQECGSSVHACTHQKCASLVHACRPQVVHIAYRQVEGQLQACSEGGGNDRLKILIQPRCLRVCILLGPRGVCGAHVVEAQCGPCILRMRGWSTPRNADLSNTMTFNPQDLDRFITKPHDTDPIIIKPHDTDITIIKVLNHMI